MQIRIFFLLLLSLFSNAYSELLNYQFLPSKFNSSSFMKVKILDAKELVFDSNIRELSALAFKNTTLYALSDRGYLYHFDLEIIKEKITKVTLKKSFELKNSKGNSLKKSKTDSEGLYFKGDDLLISFEHKSRVMLYNLNGVAKNKVKIHKKLRNLKNYKKKNRGLEAVAYSSKYGVITAPEVPLKGEKREEHTLYTKKNSYTFRADGSITALEFIAEDELLILERDMSFLSLKAVINLSKVTLSSNRSNGCKKEILARFDIREGWGVDNFEGLTKLSENKFLMVSDDNANPFQKTVLVYFELLK